MKYRSLIICSFCCLANLILLGQVDTLIRSSDPVISDSIRIDSIVKSQKFDSGIMPVGYSNDLTDEESLTQSSADFSGQGGDFSNAKTTIINYGSKDSSFLDMSKQELYLYGDAYVKYTDYEVTADYIILNFNTNNIKAGKRNKKSPRASFKSGDQNAKADEILFNIDSQKGIVYGANIEQGGMYIHGAVTKFVRAGNDSLHIEDVIYNKNALITTCDHDHPHWGIRTTKLKFIPEKLAVAGPANMEIAGIPTPLAFPFAFAPLLNFNNASTGLIAPQDFFHSSRQLGPGIRGIGYYFALSEYADLTLRSDIYYRGSWSLAASTNYRKRYKYSGNANVSFSKQLIDVAGQVDPNIQNSYSISLSHNQDSKAHPYRRIGGSLRFTVNDFDRRNFADAQSQLNSQINSNFSYNYKISDVWNFSSAISHSQNTLTRSISFTIPDVKLRMKRVFPFKSKKASNQEKWFEKINMQYNADFKNSVTTRDTILFTSETLSDFRGGFNHNADISASYSILQNISFNTNITYSESWYLQTHELKRDSNDVIKSFINNDFSPVRDLTVSANLSSVMFGTLLSDEGQIRGLRHQLRPTIGLSYSPSMENYYEYFDFDENISINKLTRYNPFNPDNPFDDSDIEYLYKNTTLKRGGLSITYNIANNFEGKFYSKKDSTEKKFKIFNSVNFSGNYNLQADSLNWSPIRFSANANIFKNITTLSINGTFDPYIETSRGRVNTTVWSQEKKLLRLDEFTVNISTGFTLADVRDWLIYKGDPPKASSRSKKEKLEYPELFSWFENARIRHVMRFGFTDRAGVKSWDFNTHSIQLTTGNIPLTDKWGMSVGNLSYDIKNKRWVYPSFTLNRDLHCWRMSISWQPQADTYSFFIGVKASPFSDFIKYQTGRTAFDTNFF